MNSFMFLLHLQQKPYLPMADYCIREGFGLLFSQEVLVTGSHQGGSVAVVMAMVVVFLAAERR